MEKQLKRNRKSASTKKDVAVEDGVSKGVSRIPEMDTMRNVKTLDDILGTSTFNHFGTVSESVFDEKIDGMNLVDLHRMAVKVGLLPVYDKNIMKSRLKKSFLTYVRSLKPYSKKGNEDYKSGISAKSEKEILKILNP